MLVRDHASDVDARREQRRSGDAQKERDYTLERINLETEYSAIRSSSAHWEEIGVHLSRHDLRIRILTGLSAFTST
jgi:hypothetical protein